MKYIQKFFLLVSLFILNLNAMSLSPTDKLSKTEEYLCKKIDSSLCGINQSYLDFHNYHKKVLHEVNFGTLTSEMENSLDTQTIQDIDTIRDLSGVYDLGGMLLAGIKYSKYYHLADQFEDQTLVPLTNIMESQNDLVWNREAQYYENQVSEFIKYKKDPYTEAIKNWKEIGRNAIDSYNQFKASADAAWSFSEATFLYSLEEAVNKVSKSAKATIDNSKALYQLVTDIVFPSIQLMEKSLKSELTLQDVSGMLEKLTALSKDLKNEDIKGANVLKAINIIDKILTSLKHKEASTRLYEKYKDDIFTNHIVGGIKASSRAELLINYSELLQFVVELTPENFNRLKKTTETIVNLIKAFGDYELKIRRVLHKDSLNDQYLSLLAKRMNISQTLYTRFMYGYFNEHMEVIINLDEYEYTHITDTNIPEIKPKLFWKVPATTKISENTIQAQIGDEIELKFTALGEDITEFVKEGIENGYKFYIWYDSADGREKVELTLKSQSDGVYTLSFLAPKEKFNMVDFGSYDPESKRYESFGIFAYTQSVISTIPESQEEKLLGDLTQDEKDSYQECIDNGGTEIGCRVGPHIVGSFYAQETNDLVVKGSYAYLADGYGGVKVLDISDPTNIKLVGSIGQEQVYYAKSIAISGNYAYIASQAAGVKVLDISDPTNPVLKISIDTQDAYDVAIEGNLLYVAGATYGVKIINISDPTNPVIIGSIGTSYAQGVTISGNYAYVADGDAGLKIIDISNPTNPTLKGSIDTNGYTVGVTISGNYAYVADYSVGLKIIDISDPTNPTIKGSIDTNSYAVGVTISGNYAYVVGGTTYGVEIIDISDPANPTLKGSIGTHGAVGVTISGNYAYVADGGAGLKIIDISNPTNPTLKGSIDTNGYTVGVTISGNYAYVVDIYKGLKIVDISDPANPTLKRSIDTNGNAVGVTISGNYAYVADVAGLKIIDISDPANPAIIGSIDTNGKAQGVTISGNYAYVADGYRGLKIIDISDPTNPTLKGSIGTNDAQGVTISGNYAYVADYGAGLKIIDISDPANPTMKGSIDTNSYAQGVTISGNYAYVAGGTTYGVEIIDISDPANPTLKRSIDTNGYAVGVTISGNYAYVADYDAGLKIIDISDPINPTIKGSIDTNGYAQGVTISGNYAYVVYSSSGLKIIDTAKAIEDYQLIQAYYHPTTEISLLSETNKDYTVQTQNFTKEWTFDQDISNFDIEIVSNSYSWINKDSFTKDEKILKVTLSPDTSNPINKLVLKFTKDGNPVKVNGSETFWSLTKTNYAPRLADGQITQLVSATDEPAVLDIETYDGDGDSVTLSIKDNAGGTVRLNGNQLTASFTDGKTEHTIKIALSDGKERVIKEFHVLQFDSSSIKDFYSDVSTNSSYPFDGIAFGTLKGVIWGQSDPDSPLKRIFRPTDDASMAEVLAMIVNAEKKAGLITLESSNYYMDVYPSWAMPYYTFARDYSAISQIRDLASYYPTREEIAKIIVKTLGLEDQIGSIALENSFEDEEDFSSNSMLYYAKIARFFGLFMTETKAKPKEHINRAELAVVIEKIFMIPDANISFDPATVEYGDNLIPVVSDIKAQSIDSNYNLVDNSKNVGVRYIYNDYFINAPIDTSKLLPSTQSVKALISNQNVKRLVDVPVTITFTDQDHDGVQDREDKWKDDPRYAFDTNKNNIPDILDEIYSLSDYNVNSIVNFDGQLVKVSDIIRDGTYIPDLDGDGIVDSEDTDDDNDGISDEDEIKYGLNPRDASDAIKDSDGDGISNIDEIAAKTDPNDKTSYPAQPQKMVKVELKRGWNLMGMDTNLSLAEIKSLIGDDNLYIIQGASKTYKKEYVDNDQAFLNDFEKFEEGKGYWIKVVKDVTFEYPQVRSKNLTIPLSKGWNLINPTAEMPVKAIQDQIGMQHLFIIQGASKTYKKEYLDNGQEFLNDFVKFEEPKGYWIKVDQDTVLEFTE